MNLHQVFNKEAEKNNFDKALVFQIVILSVLTIFGIVCYKVYKTKYTY